MLLLLPFGRGFDLLAPDKLLFANSFDLRMLLRLVTGVITTGYIHLQVQSISQPQSGLQAINTTQRSSANEIRARRRSLAARARVLLNVKGTD